MLPEARRRELLAAMGIQVYCLRSPGSRSGIISQSDPAHTLPAGDKAFSDPILVIVCDSAARSDRHFAQLWIDVPRALGLHPDRIAWLHARDAVLDSAPPIARAYLVLGVALPHALAEHLSQDRQSAVTIAIAAAPDTLRSDATAKRALWQALKPVARAIHTAERHA